MTQVPYFNLSPKHEWICSNIAQLMSSLSLLRLKDDGLTDSSNTLAMKAARQRFVESVSMTEAYENLSTPYKHYSMGAESRKVRLDKATNELAEAKEERTRSEKTLENLVKRLNVIGDDEITESDRKKLDEQKCDADKLLARNSKRREWLLRRVEEADGEFKKYSASKEEIKREMEDLELKENTLYQREKLVFLAQAVAPAVPSNYVDDGFESAGDGE
eukprot:GHVS01045620.1.p1 GENE.GHVS01045620.1~~GHVS01045620.1.p1  ORF type:complete len:232 (-),score=27.22 GHVS01045620.1:34-687(-)